MDLGPGCIQLRPQSGEGHGHSDACPPGYVSPGATPELQEAGTAAPLTDGAAGPVRVTGSVEDGWSVSGEVETPSGSPAP